MGKKIRRQKTENRGQKRRKWRVPFKVPKFLIPRDEPIVPRAFTPVDYAGGIVVFFICWAVYLHTLTPTIGFHDSGDMVTAAYVLGIPHPTGYPLYCLLGKLWMTILPIGNIAYRMNMASALCASLACMMVYFITLKVGNRKWEMGSKKGNKGFSLFIFHFSLIIPAMVAALMLAFAVTFWEQAVIAEKYTLNALFATLIIFILLKWAEVMNKGNLTKGEKPETRNPKPEHLLYLFAFTLGLSFTHHMQTIYLVPASIFFIIAVYWKKLRQEKQPIHSLLTTNYLLFLKMLCSFILPLLLYLYLPIRASDNPAYCYGKPDTLERFIAHISGGEYKSRYFTLFSMESFIKEIIKYITTFLPHQFIPYLMWSGLIGMFMVFKRKLLFLFFSLIIITNIFYGTQYHILNIKDYYIISFLIFCILSGYGIIEIIRWLSNKKIKYSMLFIFLIIPIIPFSTHYYSNDYSNYYVAYDYITNILRPLKEKAIIVLKVGNDEIIFSLAYIQDVENQHPDIKHIIYVGMKDDWYINLLKRRYPDLNLNLYQKDVQERFENFIDNHINNYPIYTYNLEIFNNYSLIPGVILYRVLKKSVTGDGMWKEIESHQLNFNNRNIYNSTIKGRKSLTELEKAIINNYANTYCNYGAMYVEKGKYNKAVIYFQKALKLNHKSVEAHNNLAVTYTLMGRQQDAIKELKKAIELEPNNIKVKQMLSKITMQD